MRIAHLRCGSDLWPALDAAAISGHRAEWADPLCLGPLRRGPRASWRSRRADFLALHLGDDLAKLEERLTRDDAAFAALAEFDEVCLWCEHDLYDQLILVYWLTHFQPLQPRVRVTLVDVGSWPGIERFVGLVQVPTTGLRDLFANRRAVGTAEFAAAFLAWSALTSPDATAVDRLRHDPSLAVLEFLPSALERWLEEFPAIGDGLGRTERSALQALSSEPRSFESLFNALAESEERPWLPDALFRGVLWRLALESMPLVSIDTDDRWVLTEIGREVLRGDTDRAFLNGYDGDHGAVRLTGRNPAFRWNRAARSLVRMTGAAPSAPG